MQLKLAVHLAADFSVETDFLLQIEAAHLPEQTVADPLLMLSPTIHTARVAAQDMIGERVWIRAFGHFEIDYSATVTIARELAEIATVPPLPHHWLPAETVPYLFASRYCPADSFQSLVELEFAGTAGGARVMAIRDWIAGNVGYVPGSSGSATTALDTFVERQGVCRDFAHLQIALTRASGIPARYAAVYAPGVVPQDFHAVAEVFLASPNGCGGTWHLIDATGMAKPAEMAKIGIGRDAADVSFLTSFGPCMITEQNISVEVC